MNRDYKICNCKKSNCLKLYCDCFATGAYCNPGKCNCLVCYNNVENEIKRNRAMISTIERDPSAFRPKVISKEIEKAHKKGCHCKRSNCLKKYCECFQCNIICSNKCKCVECLNTNMSAFRNGGGNSGSSISSTSNSLFKNGSTSSINNSSSSSSSSSSSNGTQASSSSSDYMSHTLLQSSNQGNLIESNEDSNISNLNKQPYAENTDSCLPTQTFFSQLSFSRQSSQNTFAAAITNTSTEEDSRAFSTKTALRTSGSSDNHVQVSSNADRAAALQQQATAGAVPLQASEAASSQQQQQQLHAALSLPTIKRICDDMFSSLLKRARVVAKNRVIISESSDASENDARGVNFDPREAMDCDADIDDVLNPAESLSQQQQQSFTASTTTYNNSSGSSCSEDEQKYEKLKNNVIKLFCESVTTVMHHNATLFSTGRSAAGDAAALAASPRTHRYSPHQGGSSSEEEVLTNSSSSKPQVIAHNFRAEGLSPTSALLTAAAAAPKFFVPFSSSLSSKTMLQSAELGANAGRVQPSVTTGVTAVDNDYSLQNYLLETPSLMYLDSLTQQSQGSQQLLQQQEVHVQEEEGVTLMSVASLGDDIMQFTALSQDSQNPV